MTQDMHVYGFKKRATSETNRSTHTLPILNEYGWSMARVWQQHSKALRIVMALLMMLTAEANCLWAETDYSGLYYIASVSKRAGGADNKYTYDINNPADNYYLCPTEGWCSYKATDDFEAGDNGQPFLTTYKCRAGGGYDARKALWVIEKVPNSDFYYIKQWLTGKYLVSNGKINTASNIDRMRVHLESIADPVAAGDKVLFAISLNSKSQTVISPQAIQETGKHDNFDHSKHRWLTINNGNYNFLNGQPGKAGGPTGYENTCGIVGIFDKDDANAPLYLEDASVAVPTFSMNGAGDVTITAGSGTTIYYTLDGTTPTTSSTPYSAAITAGTIPAGKTVRAIAVRTSDGVSSAVATLPLVTYHIVNKSNAIAVSSTPVRQLAGTSISGYASIPTEIQSPYISNEEITFYSMEGVFNASNLDTEHKKTEIPAQSADAECVNIYVTYSTAKLGEKFLHLQMARPMNIKHEESSTYKYIYDNNGTVTYDASEAASITDSKYLWYIGNNTAPDPYNVLVKNSTKASNLKYESATLSLDADAISYVITDSSKVDGNNYITLKDFSTGESFTIWVNEVKIPTSYYLIDKAGHILFGPKESTSSAMEIPSEWKSPVVAENGYHYWKLEAFDVADGVYTLRENQTEIGGLAELGTGEHIYITYDVDNELLDLDGRNSLEIDGKDNLTYRLQFSGGTNFYQEDGLDGVMTETRKPVYPYSNGDAALYVYGDERWEEQLANGASTRTRWLWVIEPANSPTTVAELDPYHVKISSYQTQTSKSWEVEEEGKEVTKTCNFHSYLRTYKPDGYSSIVTGVTNSNPLVHNPDYEFPTTPPSDLNSLSDPYYATEYMILGESMTSLKLVTVDAISDGSTTERRTVNSFEQYWKNNPTVQGKLTAANKVTQAGRNIKLNAAQKTEITNLGWHVYSAWANSQPWMHNDDEGHTTSKMFKNEEHVFQTISMGETFQFIETEIKPMLVLLDQHGWEIVRLPLPTGDPTTLTDEQKVERKKAYANLHKYSSPMVEKYHYWKTGTKVPGYHKFTVSDPATEKNNPLKEYTTDELGRADIDNPNTPANLPDYQSQALTSGKERDWYVTYDVKAEYVNAYTSAATGSSTAASPYLIKQNGYYAQYSGSGNTLSTTATEPNIKDVPKSMQWYIKPNFNIDEEMGYHYNGQYDEKTKDQTEQDNYDAGKNGFDPYNVQIKSAVPNTDRYFTANTSGSTVTSLWAGTSSSITLENMTEDTRQPGVVGLDQTKMKITNATFMVVDDGNGNMTLMPRFDNTKVMQSFTALATPSGAATQTFTLTQVPQIVNSSADIKVMGASYLLDYPFDASDGSIGTKTAPFIGTIEGKIGQSFSVSAPFIAYADGATIKNVIIEEASISSGNADGHAGAIVATATGATRIYNCGVKGGSVSGSNYTGGIVGLLDHDPDSKVGARVINCYSYADITGGSYVGGIVGYNNFASDSTDIRTMVMNCMFYGDITGGTNKAPIYNGLMISNKDASGLGNYNYFLAEKPYVQNKQINTYNCALMAEPRFLQRFEFYRLLLNSHLELAGWYATGEYKKDEMMKWVLETADRTNATPKPYPVLKAQGKYPSIINIDAENAPTSGERNIGKNLGSLAVSIQMGDGDDAQFKAPNGASITESSLSLPITDKDFERFNFNYRKVQLPYYNDVGTKNYTGNRVVTGWKIVSISGGTAGSFTTGDDAPAYNFADRNCTNKDKYDVSGRVFNQGAYWDVPEGVTGITIEPYWAHAVYLADAYTDVVYNQEMGTPYNVTAAGGQIYTNGSKYDIAGDNDQKVYTNVKDAREKLETNKTVYDCAIVLVGNFHNIGVSSTEGSRSYTIMSADFDHDNEPDYSYILRFDNRNQTHPVRVDFVNIPGLGMAQKSTGGKGTYNFGIMQPIGWFESTNTSLFRVTQFEYDRENRGEAPLIVQGGVMEQWVSGQSNKVANKTTYFHVGGNAWFKEFQRGTHQDQTYTSKHPPVSVTGGDYDEFYLTGLYRGDVASYADNAECYINGGRFGILAGAAQEGIGKANGADNTGNITWQIQNADIREFYGGGFNAAKPVTGNISTTITGSYVTTFCGGPKFGDMSTNKTVSTNATDCTFGTYFGAGYGGNSYSRQAPRNHNNIINFPHNDNQAGNHASWNAWLNAYYKQDYNATYGGVSTQFNYQFLPMSGNKDNVARIFVEYVKFSLATTRNVTSTLTGCTVTGNFYGGGSLGKVDGNVTSTLNGCTVKGNVFGAGFSASLPPVEVDSLGFRKEPEYYDQTGTFAEGVKGTTTTFHWQHGDAISIDKEHNILYTTEDLTGLGAVTGTVTLTIDGATVVGDNAIANSGNVYGGGESSDATGDVNVHILNGSMNDVYGGGKGETTVVGGDVTVNIGGKSGEGTLSGSGVVNGSVYGGSALGAVNATSTKDGNGNITGYTPTNKTTLVNIYKGTVNDSVFGGGLGQLASAVQAAIAAQNFGNTIINMEGGSVGDAIFGGANVNGVLKADAEVTLLGGMIGDSEDTSKDVVFGGGKGEPTLVNGSVTVNVGTKSNDPTPVYNGTSVIYGNVYGGSALGNTNASKTGSDPMVFNASATTNVNLYAGTINGNVFGGGLGRQYKAAVVADPEHGVEAQPAVTAVESFVGGDVFVTLDGARLNCTFTGTGDDRMPLTGQIFGANNLNGTPKGHVKVWVKRTIGTDKSSVEALAKTLDQRGGLDPYSYDVAAVYGGGNKADYNPTKATGSDDDKKKAFAEVLIDGCNETSIEYVYGGGNAAAVPATEVTINGTYIIDQLFGGGNGKSTATFTNPGANVGIYDADGTPSNYGTGIAETKLVGGQVHVVYGGSNTLGNVRGGTKLNRNESNDCPLKVGEIYGAGQVAPMDGDVNIILECMPNDFVEAVYGGAKNAEINGNVSLTVTSGKYGYVFGGNNLGGSINGSITVNVYEDGCEPLIIGELYGGGYNAPYSIWGCNDSDNDGTWIPNTPGGVPHVAANANAISVNVFSCTSIGKVFGGGYGATANVVGNTHVWINTMQGLVNGEEQTYETVPEKVYIGKIGQVFGGGNAAPVKGDVTIDIGTATVNKIHSTGEDAEKIGVRIISGTDYLNAESNTSTSITAGIYGGGNAADVDGNITMNIGTVSQNQGINIAGNIFGGGYGESTHVTGNVTVNIGKKESETPVGYANITGDVYGGSAKGKVNTTDGSSISDGSPTTQVNFYGGTIQDTETPSGKGNIYGGGLGEDNEGTETDHAADVYGPVTVTLEKGSTTNTVVNNVFGCNNVLGTPKNTVTVNINGGTVNHSVYGGGKDAAYTPTESTSNYPAVNINNGTVMENVFGGGLGTTATVTGNPHVTMAGGEVKMSVYGGGSLASVDGSTNIVVNSGTIGTEGEGGATYGNIYGGGYGSSANVRIGLVKGNTNITVNGGNVLHNIYGGGAYGSVGTYTYASNAANAAINGHTDNTGKTTITIKGGTIGTNGHENGMIFGASRGDIAAPGAIQDNMAWVYDTEVVIGQTNDATVGPQIRGSVYGSGENGHTYHDASVTIHSGKVGITEDLDSDPVGQKGAYYPYRGNVYGGGCGTDKYYSGTIPDGHTEHDGHGDKYNITAGIVKGNATVTIDGGHVVRNVYGGGAMGSVTDTTKVTISGKSIIGADGSGGGYVYAASRGYDDMEAGFATVGSTMLNISGGTIWQSAFGGGQLGTVKGSVAVNVSGGVVKNDVYGGGALANTNTDNWNTTGSAIEYVVVDPSTFTPTYSIKEVKAGDSVEGLFTYNSSTSEYVAAHDYAVAGTTYYQYVSGSSVAGYYTRSADEPYVYTLVPSGSAAGGTTYYKKKVVGDWKASHPHTTTVVLTGGVIGNAYGGGLGSSSVAANVYGDVKVTVNKPEEMSSTGGSGIAFTRNTVSVTYGTGDKKKEYIIPVTGRVFGCNNINGTPTGNVEVEVYGTRQIEINGQDNYTLYPIAGEGSEHSPNGHNKYYEVQAVYGGGNLSDYLPATGKATYVYITGCDSTSIEKVYGGGNSAVVPSSNVVINGSFDIGTAFGGGNGGDLVQKDGVWYENDGAIVIGTALMKPKGGKVGEIFGGSDAKGYCGNPIIDKTEHNDDCPLVVTRMYGAGKESDVDNVDIVISGCTAGNTEIEYVFGGSYNAHIAGYINLTITAGVFKNVFGGNDRTGSIGGNITVNIEETENCEKPLIIQNLFGGGNEAAYPGTKRDRTEITTPGKITVNVKSATRIDNVFGGSFKADVNGDTEVNINMTKGFWANKTYDGKLIPDSVGVIGNIYGGGNQGVVRGNSKVNICTADSVGYKTIPAHLSGYKEKDGLYYVPVTGARITGDVFGGGSEANVNGNATVNICTANYAGVAGFQGVAISKGSVYGGGSAGDVLGNTNVTMDGGYVFDGVYGGGLMGSVGTAADGEGNVIYHTGTEAHAGCIGKIVNYKANTGKCTVVVTGGQVGPKEVALADGGMKNTARYFKDPKDPKDVGPVDVGFVFGAGRGEVEDPATDKDADFRTFVKETDVTVGGTAFIMASVYGGGENGRVANDTHVTIEGDCQIGCGEGKVTDGKPVRYTTAQWTGEDASNFTECASWDYTSPFLPHDPYAAAGDAEDAKVGTDGHTYYGSVFGGGSGYYPYKKADGTHEWLRSAGQVYGNTVIDITGGHILTSVYGGNETTDVGTYTKNDKGFPIVWSSGGKCTINMVGGTIGVPRTEERMKAHPVTCYLFGAGKGDQRTSFNTWTNVQETEVNVSGTARIFGSVFGGGEDGHILGNAKVNIGGTVKIDLNGDGDRDDSGETFTADSKLKIGTTGTSYVDGNVFGGGRGFSGVALTAGSTGGNVEMNITSGTMLGSIYGGGRLASVGIGFTPPEDIYYGQLIDDTDEDKDGSIEDSEKHGHITINISGANTVIGNGTTETGAGHPISGNVFGGSMGRLTLLDNVTRIPLWPKQSVTKEATVNISGGTIWNSVYGGSEIGIVRNLATVNVSGGTIHGNVFGGGYGSDEQDKKTISAGGYASIPTVHYTFTPMIWTGCVSGDTYVNISGGTIEKNVYGGGNFASVGLMNYNSNEDGTVYNYITKHDIADGFGLSWPYEFQYIQHAPTDDAPGGKKIGGKTTVNITGGRIGTTANAGYGNVYGGSKGMVSLYKEDNKTLITDVNEQRYAEAFCANVRETAVTVNYGSTPSSDDGSTTPCIVGAVYGGGQDGHVYENANVTITKGLIGLSVYGGGQGESTFLGKLRDQSTRAWKDTTEPVHSITAGKVYGNTSVSMSGGLVVGHVYGGGNLASVGKGNYAGGADDYFPTGYGETLTGNLWDNVSANSKAFLGSGNVTVSITGGTVGTLNGTSGTVFGTSEVTPTGIVFGGSRGRAAQDVMLDPRHEYAPDFYLGYVNTTKVTIGNADGGPRIFSQVFGGGRDGHVRDSSYVIINNGTIGQTYDETTAVAGSTKEYQLYHRGNVYGSGSGLGDWNTDPDVVNHGMASGSVTNKTTVDINGGTIYNNVYGGGALSSVGPPRLDLTKDYAPASISKCTVNINGGTIGQTADYESYKYGGCVYGASRGNDFLAGESPENFATVLWTKVNINGGNIAGNVYGGAKGGLVWKDTEVHLKGGTIAHNAYGGGQGTRISGATTEGIAADVGGNTTVKLNEGKTASSNGCIVEKVFGCNDLNGTPKGHALVHVYATQHKGKTKIVPDGGKYAKFGNVVEDYSITNYSGLTTLAAATGTNVTAYTDILSGSGTTDEKNKALADMMEAIADDKYDVLAVYGGGDLAPYEPTNPNETTDVIIDGCDFTSIKQVYGGGNAASTPANQVKINEVYEIHEAFGGGNGKDDYEIDGKYYKNLGANIGYKATFYSDKTDPAKGTKVNPYPAVAYADADTPEERRANTSYHYGTGTAHLIISGGRVHSTYGGSNMKGNVRAEAVTSTEDAGDCTMLIDVSTAAGKNADTDGGARLDSRCVDYQAAIYGGSTDANVYNDVVINITNGTYGKIFGGNNLSGKIYGSITINVHEEGCKPIVIDSLFAGGNEAAYSIYGFNDNGSARTKAEYDDLTPEEQARVLQRNPQINIISATRIGTIYGGGYKAKVIGSPSVNVNMEEGFVAAKYATDEKYDPGYHELVEHDLNCSYDVLRKDAEGKAILKIGTIGTIFGGGSKGDVVGDTRVDIGTGKHFNFAGEEEIITPARNAAFILGEVVDGKYVGGQVFGGGDQGDVYGNTTVNIANGYIYDRVYGGGKEGTVGTVSTRADLPTGHTSHEGCLGGKPTAFTANTGRTEVTVSGGYVGPYDYQRSINSGNPIPKPMTMPQDFGYVFAAGRGELTNPATDPDIDLRTYVDSTVVTISDSALIAGGVYGGSENGRVLRNTHVNIRGGQIGLGAGQTTAYDEANFIDPTTATAEEIATKAAAMPECASWAYGSPWLPYDEHAGNGHYQTSTYGEASTTGSDGHTFYGNVFGGGSGYFAYETATTGVYEWLPSAGLVEGDTYVNISGGHILTNVYGGNEMTNVTGTAHVTMTGGTLGVPRTLAQIAAHPVTCYLFGGGKGDQRVHFNKSTNVGHAKVNVSGGIIYGSVFGGGEDGHVLGDVTMNISDGAKIGTWGTSYVDGNVFGGGRGFSGDAYTAGNVAGSVNLTISGGTMLGSVYGGGRLGSVGYGLYDAGAEGYGEMRDDDKMDDGTDGTSFFTKGRGHVEINISGGTIGNNREYIIPNATNIAAAGIAETDISKWKPESEDGSEWTTWKTYHHVPSTTYDTSDGKLHHTRGGNVYAGAMGRRENLNGQVISMAREGVNWLKLGNVKSTKLTITGGTIKSNVYGGGEYGAVQGNHKVLDGEGNPIVVNEKNVVAGTEIIITGGTIGSEILGNSASDVKYTYGSVFGGGTGTTDDVAMTDPVIKADTLGAYVADSTRITLTNAIVKASVFGGGELSAVGGNTNVNISGTTAIGRNEVYGIDEIYKLPDTKNPGYVKYGSWRMGNVYGGGRGSEKAAIAGLVKGNTNINISGGNVYHMVYGGGALGSVGDFKISDGAGNPSYIPIAGIPYDWKYTDGTVIDPANPDAENTPTGTATVTITGGTIGISGRDNGLVFGSSRGNLKKPETDANEGGKKVDPYDRVAWVNKSVVNIGTKGSGSVYTTPLIKGSVYGGGENGHNADSAIVNIYSGTIGIANTIPGTKTADPWWDFKNDSLNTVYRGNRGNVYGAGSGSDTYTGDDGKEHYNPKSGMVGRNTVVNIYGGHVGRNVYGGGSMAMVGTITNVNDTISAAKHTSETTSFALSWPYKFEFEDNTGKATVNITGGHIGTLQTDGGDVYGSSRGEAGDRYTTAHLAYVKETEVNIDYPTTADLPNMEAIQNDFTIPCITGAVHGSGENGYVYGDTKVTLKGGLIGHSLYGGGKGKGTYTKTLNNVVGSGTHEAKIYSLIAGKVFGNTSITMLGGRVGRNVYGGGNMGSVGKGNYAGGTDDYVNDCTIGAAQGYGEKIEAALWTPTPGFDPKAAITNSNKPTTNADYFLSSGIATVNVISGTVGYIDSSDPTASMKNQLPYGNVIGGSAGEAAPNVANNPRYEYSPAFFSGYVNETDVTIGGYKCKEDYGGYKKDSLITAAAFSEVAVTDTAKWEVVGPTIYASVYGGGQDGHVRRDTKVTVLGGEIGLPFTEANKTLLKTTSSDINEVLDNPQWLHRGNVYGGGSGITKYKYDFNGDGDTADANEQDYSNSSGSVTRFTEVNILGGIIHRNVYGGGSMGSVGAPNMGQTYAPYKKDDTADGHGAGRQSQNTINIGGGKRVAIIGTPYDSAKGWSYNKLYGGEVYGASRGLSTLDPEEFSNSVWTKVNIFDKATIMGNVYGGGDNGAVKKNTEVNIGGE